MVQLLCVPFRHHRLMQSHEFEDAIRRPQRGRSALAQGLDQMRLSRCEPPETRWPHAGAVQEAVYLFEQGMVGESVHAAD